MRRIPLLLLTLCAAAVPAAAQLTPEQRQQAESRANVESRERSRDEERERRSLAGDPTAYGGPAAAETARGRRLREWRYLNVRMSPPADATPGHWIKLASAPSRTTALRRATSAVPMHWKAEKPCLLTLASPIGAPGRALMIRTRVFDREDAPVWTRMGEVTADEVGRYLVAMPTIAAGRYTLAIEIYDLEHPEEPYSSTRTPLVVE